VSNPWPSNFWTVIGFAIFLLIIGLPTWVPIIRKKSAPFSMYRLALILTASSHAVQAYFVLKTGIFVPYARSYAALGLPLGIAGAGFVSINIVSERRGVGCLVQDSWPCVQVHAAKHQLLPKPDEAAQPTKLVLSLATLTRRTLYAEKRKTRERHHEKNPCFGDGHLYSLSHFRSGQN
jgi:hypothetical protein